MHIPTQIPDKAVDAGYEAAGEAVARYGSTVDSPQLSQIIVEAIQAAAPFIAAQALRDAADDPTGRYNWGRGGYLDRLRARADELDQS